MLQELWFGEAVCVKQLGSAGAASGSSAEAGFHTGYDRSASQRWRVPVWRMHSRWTQCPVAADISLFSRRGFHFGLASQFIGLKKHLIRSFGQIGVDIINFPCEIRVGCILFYNQQQLFGSPGVLAKDPEKLPAKCHCLGCLLPKASVFGYDYVTFGIDLSYYSLCSFSFFSSVIADLKSNWISSLSFSAICYFENHFPDVE